MSLFRWIDDWWRSGGGAVVRGKEVTFPASGGTTAVSEPAAAPLGSGDLEVWLLYRAPTEDITLSVYVTRFRQKGTSRISDSKRVTKRLTRTDRRRLEVIRLEPGMTKVEGAEYFRPVINIDGGGLVLEDVTVAYARTGAKVLVWDGSREIPTIALQVHPGTPATPEVSP